MNREPRIVQYLAYASAFNGARALIQSTIILYLVDVMRLPLSWTSILLAIDLGVTLLLEIPTGFFADIKGRRKSFIVACALSMAGAFTYGAPMFLSISGPPEVLLALAAIAEAVLAVGFTFYSGALDAWIVDSMPQAEGSVRVGQVLSQGQFVKNAAFLVAGVAGIVIYFEFTNSAIVNTFFFSGLIMAFTFVHALFRMKKDSEEIHFPNENTFEVVKRDAMLSTIKASLQNSPLLLLLVSSSVCFALLQLLVHFWPYFLTKQTTGSGLDRGGMVGLILSWASAYGARGLGNYQAGIGMASRLIRLQLCVAVLLGALVVLGISVASLGPTGIGLSPIAASVLYASVRFFDGFAEPIRLKMLTDFTVRRSRATLYSISSFVSMFISAGAALGAAAMIGLGAGVPHVWLVGAALQVCTVPVYYMLWKKGGSHEHRD